MSLSKLKIKLNRSVAMWACVQTGINGDAFTASWAFNLHPMCGLYDSIAKIILEISFELSHIRRLAEVILPVHRYHPLSRGIVTIHPHIKKERHERRSIELGHTPGTV